MEQKINVRGIVIEDYEFINQWWLDHGEDPPQLHLLPDNGLGGVIAEIGEEKRPIAAAYLYSTNSSLMYVDSGIFNPNYKSRDKFDIGVAVLNECVRKATALGCEVVEVVTCETGLVKRFEKLNWKISKKNFHVITKYIHNAR